jgi:hypothetical protein
MSLSPEEKAAGRRFRDQAQATLLASFDSDPPDHTVPNFLALYRHSCPARQGRSTALELKEIYVSSPAYDVITLSGSVLHVAESTDPMLPETCRHEGVVITFVPASRFGFIYRDGVCRSCRQTARSRAGRLIDAWERPPIQGRVARS